MIVRTILVTLGVTGILLTGGVIAACIVASEYDRESEEKDEET